MAWAEANYGVDVATIDLYRTPRKDWDELEDMYADMEKKIPIIFGEFTYRGNVSLSFMSLSIFNQNVGHWAQQYQRCWRSCGKSSCTW